MREAGVARPAEAEPREACAPLRVARVAAYGVLHRHELLPVEPLDLRRVALQRGEELVRLDLGDAALRLDAAEPLRRVAVEEGERDLLRRLLDVRRQRELLVLRQVPEEEEASQNNCAELRQNCARIARSTGRWRSRTSRARA